MKISTGCLAVSRPPVCSVAVPPEVYDMSGCCDTGTQTEIDVGNHRTTGSVEDLVLAAIADVSRSVARRVTDRIEEI